MRGASASHFSCLRSIKLYRTSGQHPPSGTRALVNHTCDYRLRVGNYRVLFNHDSLVEIISIEEVKKRDDHTY